MIAFLIVAAAICAAVSYRLGYRAGQISRLCDHLTEGESR